MAKASREESCTPIFQHSVLRSLTSLQLCLPVLTVLTPCVVKARFPAKYCIVQSARVREHHKSNAVGYYGRNERTLPLATGASLSSWQRCAVATLKVDSETSEKFGPRTTA